MSAQKNRNFYLFSFYLTVAQTPCVSQAYADPHQRNIKVRITNPLWGEFACDRGVPAGRVNSLTHWGALEHIYVSEQDRHWSNALSFIWRQVITFDLLLLSGVPDYFDRNKILSGYDLSHYQVPHCIKSFLLFCLICVYSSQFSILFWIMYLL